jgi:CRP/FNR family transcriptional regulator
MDNTCAQCEHQLCTGRVPIFADLTHDEQLEIVRLIQHAVIEKGQPVYHEGDRSDKLLIITRGSVRLFKNTLDGREQNLDILVTGDFTGELDLLGDATYSHEAVALERTLLCIISQDQIKGLIERNPLIGFKIIKAMNQKLSSLQSLVQSLATTEGLPRLAHLLLQLYQKNGGQQTITLNLSREDIASFTGLTRETISRKLAQLQEDGIVRLSKVREIEILDLEALRRLSGV